jgi:AcrR family transcriptional regulator
MLAAAVALAAERGAAEVNVSRIVARSGVSRRTFYEIFQGREECLLAALDDTIEQAGRRILAGYPVDAPWRERVRAGLTALLVYLEEEPAAARLLIVESLAAGPHALQRRAQVLRTLAEVVAEGAQVARRSAGAPAMLTGEGTVGAVLAVIHARMIAESCPRLVAFAGELTAIVVQPYLGAGVARREASRTVPRSSRRPPKPSTGIGDDVLQGLGMRLTYRTIRVLAGLHEHPGASNRSIGHIADIRDPGQISKLLTRLAGLGLIENTTDRVQARGAPNAWALTEMGRRVRGSIDVVA